MSEPSTLRSHEGLAADVWVDEGVAVCSLRSNGVELLGAPGARDIFRRPDVRLAMALLYPWANRLSSDRYTVAGRRAHVDAVKPGVLRDSEGRAIHGFTGRDPGWRTTQVDDAGLAAERVWEPRNPRFSAFPFEHVTRVLIELSANAVSVTTTLVPTADHIVPACFGWHPYFAPPEESRSNWRLETDTGTRMVGEAHLDYGFAVPPGQVTLKTGGWRFIVHLDGGYRFVQIYAPANRPVVCVEPMIAPTNALVSGRALPLAKPGSSFHARFRIELDGPCCRR